MNFQTVKFLKDERSILSMYSYMHSTGLIPPQKIASELLEKEWILAFPGGLVVGSPPANARHRGLIPVRGRSHVPRSSEAREPQPLSPGT